jgi:hypothetical protein
VSRKTRNCAATCQGCTGTPVSPFNRNYTYDGYRVCVHGVFKMCPRFTGRPEGSSATHELAPVRPHATRACSKSRRSSRFTVTLSGSESAAPCRREKPCGHCPGVGRSPLRAVPGRTRGSPCPMESNRTRIRLGVSLRACYSGGSVACAGGGRLAASRASANLTVASLRVRVPQGTPAQPPLVACPCAFGESAPN